MKLIQFIVICVIAFLFASCGSKNDSFTAVNSQSFADRQISFGSSIASRIGTDSVDHNQELNPLFKKLDELISRAEGLKTDKSDSSWNFLSKDWEDFKINNPVSTADTSAISRLALQKWADLNIILLKFSGEVRFGDEIEKSFYETRAPVLTEKMLKSVIYTHIYDQIFINVFGTSSLVHQHTTGGTIKLIQETNFPASNEITLKCESNDVRYLDLFIRIPQWAVNPKVTHGNVKYVAYPGEYCEISRKWNDGDEIKIVLKN